jgi:replication initiation and membrane attachment protein DnaB
LLVLPVDPEDGGDMFLRTARRYSPGDFALHSHLRENLSSNVDENVFDTLQECFEQTINSDEFPETYIAAAAHITFTAFQFLAYFPYFEKIKRLMRSPCCLCIPLIFSFSMLSVTYQRKLGD